MSGNVWEWTNDYYDSDYYSKSPVDNPQGPLKGSYRILRGGGWGNYLGGIRIVNRARNLDWYRSSSLDFRLAVSLLGK